MVTEFTVIAEKPTFSARVQALSPEDALGEVLIRLRPHFWGDRYNQSAFLVEDQADQTTYEFTVQREFDRGAAKFVITDCDAYEGSIDCFSRCFEV